MFEMIASILDLKCLWCLPRPTSYFKPQRKQKFNSLRLTYLGEVHLELGTDKDGDLMQSYTE